MAQTVIVVSEQGPDDARYTTTQQSTQTIELLGQVDTTGSVHGDGVTFNSYELISCEPAENCGVVTATPTPPDWVAVTFTGMIDDGVLLAEVINSVSGTPFSFEAQRD